MSTHGETEDRLVRSIRARLEALPHPEIKDHALGELGMVRRVEAGPETVAVTLAMPMTEGEARQVLCSLAASTARELAQDRRVSVEVERMSPRERAAMMAVARGEDPVQAALQCAAPVVAVMSGKGGVGKSSVAALLAVALKRGGFATGILDADITGASIPRMFGLASGVTAGDGRWEPAASRTGIRIMSINLLLRSEDEAVVWRGPLISRTIQQFWADVDWGSPDYLVVDLPPGTSDAALTVMQSLPVSGVLLVSSPQELAAMVVRKAARLVKQLETPLIGLIENMSYAVCPRCGERLEIFGPGGTTETAGLIGAEVLARLALDPALARACDRGGIEEYDCPALADAVDAVCRAVPVARRSEIREARSGA